MEADLTVRPGCLTPYPKSEMAQDFCPFHFCQVGRHILLNLRPDCRFQFSQQLVVDLAAGGQQATFHLRVARQHVEALGKLAHQALARLQFDIMPLPIRHSPPRPRHTRAARKPAGQIRHLIHQLPMGVGVVELLHQLNVPRGMRVIILQLEGFETSKVRDYNQSILHSIVFVLNRTGSPCGRALSCCTLPQVSRTRSWQSMALIPRSAGAAFAFCQLPPMRRSRRPLTLSHTADTFRLLSDAEWTTRTH